MAPAYKAAPPWKHVDLDDAHIHCPGCLCPTPADTAGVLKLWAAQDHNDRVVEQLRAVGLEAAAAVVAQLRPKAVHQ